MAAADKPADFVAGSPNELEMVFRAGMSKTALSAEDFGYSRCPR